MADLAPEILGFRDFAKSQGWLPSYVTQLKQAGRLVLTDDGRRVRVAESLRLIADTRDPAKAGVAARHAAARGQGGATTAAEPPAGDSGADVAPDASPALQDDPHSLRRAKALADKEEALARRVLREEQVEIGELLPRDQVVAVVADAVVQLRTRLEVLPATLAPALAATDDEARVKVLLRDAVEQALEELARKFGAIGKVAA